MKHPEGISPLDQGMAKGERRRFQGLLHWQKISGQSIVVNDFTLTPQSWALIVRFPRGAFVWHRPSAVLVERNGQMQHLPIVDLTRAIQLGLLGLGGIIITIVAFVRFARRKERVL
ncbi:MAG TPA: hypothetical protein VKR06_24455 [Ktedonosporobacter sp.]|nr:hypothetical protein [Ktedonosporobacter sp.]